MRLSNKFTSPLTNLGKLEEKLPNELDIYMELFLKLAEKYDDLVCLRGNILLNQILSNQARSTKDLDIHVAMTVDNYNKNILPLLISFAEDLVSTGSADSYSVREITPTTGGNIRIKKNVNGQDRIIYSVDAEIDMDLHTGAVKYIFKNKEVLGSSIEKIISDKCLSTLSVKRFRRIKDFYDLYIIINSGLQYTLSTVYELMINSVGLEEVTSLLNNIPFDAKTLCELSNTWGKLTLNHFDNITLYKPTFNEVYSTINLLYTNLKHLQ